MWECCNGSIHKTADQTTWNHKDATTNKMQTQGRSRRSKTTAALMVICSLLYLSESAFRGESADEVWMRV